MTRAGSAERLRQLRSTLLNAFEDAFGEYGSPQLDLHFSHLDLKTHTQASLGDLRNAPFLKGLRNLEQVLTTWARLENVELQTPGTEQTGFRLLTAAGRPSKSELDYQFYQFGLRTMVRLIGRQAPRLEVPQGKEWEEWLGATLKKPNQTDHGIAHMEFLPLGMIVEYCKKHNATVLKLPPAFDFSVRNTAPREPKQLAFVTISGYTVRHLYTMHPALDEGAEPEYLEKYRLLGSINAQYTDDDYQLEPANGMWVMTSKAIAGDTADSFVNNAWPLLSSGTQFERERERDGLRGHFVSICRAFLPLSVGGQVADRGTYCVWKYPTGDRFRSLGWRVVLPRLAKHSDLQGLLNLELPKEMLYGGVVENKHEAPRFVVHGDEWGKNILVGRNGGAHLIDFEDGLIAEYDDMGRYSQFRQVGNSHWKRIFDIEESAEPDLSNLPLEGLNVVSSLARMFAALLQRATMVDEHKNSQSTRIRAFLQSMDAAIKEVLRQLPVQQHGPLSEDELTTWKRFFHLAFLDWLLHWRNKPRKDGEGVYLTDAVFKACLNHISNDEDLGEAGDGDGEDVDKNGTGGEGGLGQSIHGNQNMQITSGGTVNIIHGISPEKHAETLAENNALNNRVAELMAVLDQMENEEDQAAQEALAKRATDEAEALANQARVEFSPDEMVKIADANHLAGRLEVAEGHLKQALRSFRAEADLQGEADALNNLGLIAKTRGDLAEAERLHRESLAIKREIGDRQGEAASLGNLGNIAVKRGDLAEAERLQRESLAIEREIGDRQGEADSLNNLGNIAQTRGDLAEAERLYRDCLDIMREMGNRQGEAGSLGNLGVIAQSRGDLAEAERLHRECLGIMRGIGDRHGEAGSLNNLGNIADTRGALDEAERLHRECLGIMREIGDRQGEARSIGVLSVLMKQRGHGPEASSLRDQAVALWESLGHPVPAWFSNAWS